MMVPVVARPYLLATFNSGFYEEDSAAGFYSHHTAFYPMVNGRATLVTYTDGRVDVLTWTSGQVIPATIGTARQNLNLLVENHHATSATIATPYMWGSTLHGLPKVWRSGVGVDDHGNLLYVAAPDQSAASLAAIFVRLGAVRAMEMDINPAWPIFVTYGARGGLLPVLRVSNPNQTARRFLYSSTKDFYAVYLRSATTVQVPW